MTAPDLPTWTVADHAGMPTLLRDGQPVACLDGGQLCVSPVFAEQGFALLTAVFAPDEATVERLAIALAKSEAVSFDLNVQAFRDHYTRLAEAALAALAGTSALAPESEAVS